MHPYAVVLFSKEKDVISEYKSYKFIKLYYCEKTSDKKTTKWIELLKIADYHFIRINGNIVMCIEKIYKIIQIQVCSSLVRLVEFLVYFLYYFVSYHLYSEISAVGETQVNQVNIPQNLHRIIMMRSAKLSAELATHKIKT